MSKLVIELFFTIHFIIADLTEIVVFFSKRDIPSANYEMHTVHCQRNITLCPNCEEPVPRSEMEDHVKEFHSIIACPECREKMERSALESHKVL